MNLDITLDINRFREKKGIWKMGPQKTWDSYTFIHWHIRCLFGFNVFGSHIVTDQL